MSTLDLRTATLDDMVFEGRNKAYGAFVLRRLYHQHLARASATAIVLSLLLISSPLIIRWLFPPLVEAVGPVELPTPVEPIKPPVFDKKSEVAPPPAAAKPVVVRPPAQDIATQVVKDELVKPDIVKPVVTDVGPITDIETIAGPTGKTGTGTDTGAGTGMGRADSGTTKSAASPVPFITAEVMPQFVGGNAALMKYMQKNLKYPPLALRNNIEGKVFISFTVQADGSIADVQVLKGLGFGTDEEAARVVKGMPAWVPGQQNKRSVAVRYNMPITFRYD